MKWFVPVVALIVGLLCGLMFGRGGSGAPENDHGGHEPVARIPAGAETREAEPAEELTRAELKAVEAVGLDEAWMDALEEKSQYEQFGLLHQRIGTAPPDDFPLLMEALNKSGGSMKWLARRMLATRWAESDPQGMLTYLETQPRNERWGLTNAFFGAWAESDPDAAYLAAQQVTDRNIQRSALNAVIQSIAEEQPRQAIRMALEIDGIAGQRASWVMRNIFSRWSHDEPEEARQMALELPEGQMKVQALTGALDQLIHDDPLAALEWLDSLPPDGTTYNARKQVFRNLLNQDFDVAKDFVESENNPLERREILNNVYFGNFAWNKDFEEIEGMFNWMGTVTTGQVYDNKVSDILRTMVDSDPQRASDFALQMKPGNARMNALGAVANQLAQTDPAAALAFATGLPYRDERMRALSNMSWNLSRNHSQAARDLVAQSDDPLVQQQLANQVAREWSLYEMDAALAWSEALTDEQARRSSVQSVLENWIQSDPQAAFSYIDTQILEADQSVYYSSVYGNWSRQDPGMAAEWLAELPEGVERQDQIYRTVANAYVSHDPMAASEWISSLEEGDSRDSAIDSLVGNISRSDPEAAFIWSTAVTDDEKRSNNLRRSVREWAKEDADAAFDAIADSEITAEEKEPLLEIIERQREKDEN